MSETRFMSIIHTREDCNLFWAAMDVQHPNHIQAIKKHIAMMTTLKETHCKECLNRDATTS